MWINTIFLDLDGVVADFDGHLFSLYNLSPDLKDKVTRWDGHAEIIARETQTSVTEEDIWNKVQKQGIEFWESIPVLPWAYDVYELCLSSRSDVIFMTSPENPAIEFCLPGKVQWMRKHFPHVKGFSFTNRKHLAASHHRLLIDDNKKWCLNFRQEGGQAYCFPRPWNCNDWEERDPLKEIYALLNAPKLFP